MNDANNKKILILTITAGQGHNSAAYSMKDRLEKMGHEVKVVDILKEYASRLSEWLVDGAYSFVVGHLRPIFNLFYNKYMKSPVYKEAVCSSQYSVKKINGKLLKLIYEFKPDVIYTTSYYGGMALSNLRRVYKIPSVNVACMLDYVVSPFWEASSLGVDYLTLSHQQFKNKLLERGFREEQLVVTGIPVSEKFLEVVDKEEARKKLGLKKDMFTLLIFYGGGHWRGGYEVLHALLKKIKKPIQIVVVNGHNEKSKKKIDKEMKNYPENFVVKNIGFSKQIDLIMSACDCLVGKGGGLSTTEAINKELPLIATTKLPSQEVYNIRFLQENGMGLSFKNNKELVDKVNYVMENPQYLEMMKADLKSIKTNAIETIANLIDSQGYADYTWVNTSLDYGRVNKIVNKRRKKDYKLRRKEMKYAEKNN